MPNAVIYARYSSANQTEQSIEGQLRDCRAYAERENLTVIHEYIDRAISGRSDDRPDFQRMIADSAKKQFQHVIVWKLDRFSRDAYDTAIYKRRLKNNGVSLLSATEAIGNNPESIILEQLLIGMAEYYSVELSQKTKRGLRETALKGNFAGGGVPIGYKVENSKLVIDEETAPFVRQFFALYAGGYTKQQTIDYFKERGVRQVNGKELTNNCFQRMLVNRKYIGEYRYGDLEVAGGCPRLIDDKTFQAVQERLKTNRKRGAMNKAKANFSLSGKAYCGYCGELMTGDSGTSKTGKTHHYYKCAGRKHHSTDCAKATEPKDKLEAEVVSMTAEFVLNENNIDRIADAVFQNYNRKEDASVLQSIAQKIDHIDKDILKLVSSIPQMPQSALSAIGDQIEALEKKKAALQKDAAQIKLSLDMRLDPEKIKALLKFQCRGNVEDPSVQKRILTTFVNSAFIYDDRIAIFYNLRESSDFKSQRGTDPKNLQSMREKCSDIKIQREADGGRTHDLLIHSQALRH